jgi:hypothetical protein
MSKKERDYKIGPDVAEDELDRWLEKMDIDDDVEAMKESDVDAFNNQTRKLKLAIRRGALVITTDGLAEYTPQNEKSKNQDALIFHERSGASVMAMDRHKKDHDVAKSYAIMADMCRVPQKVFAGMVGIDCKVCEAIFALLMD